MSNESLVERAKKVKEQHQPPSTAFLKPKKDYPTGFEPGINTEDGTITGRFTHPVDDDDLPGEFEQLLLAWGFDPDLFAIEDDRVEVRTWDAHYGKEQEPRKFWYYKARVIKRQQPFNVDELVDQLRHRQPLKNDRKPGGGDRAFVVLNADWQLGKRDGPGTEFTIKAVQNTIDVIKERYTSLREQGRELTDLIIANLGDLIEGCEGHYPMQTFGAELSRREQVRLGRQLLLEQIKAWADDFDRVLVLAIPGNHGEYRNEDGKTFTNLGDNDDIALVEQVAEAFDLAKEVTERYDHVQFYIPDNELNMVLDVQGTLVGFTHGHVGNRRRSSQRNLSHTKVWDWWQGQVMGNQPVRDVELLISGHYHYFSMFEQGGRTALQAPSLEGGSEWYTDTEGMWATAATCTLVVGGGRWQDVDVTPAESILADDS